MSAVCLSIHKVSYETTIMWSIWGRFIEQFPRTELGTETAVLVQLQFRAAAFTDPC